MITYQASDIIKRATQLADLENSDFITFSEKISLLNEAYTGMYQRVINRGDSNFLRIISTSNSVVELPKDFWQLKAININSNGYLKQVLRRPANQTVNYLSYDIMNNTLVINGNTTGATVNIEYYPVPVTLTFPARPKELASSNIVDMHKNFYLTAVYDSNKYVLHDTLDSSVNIEINVSPTTYNRVHMEDDYIVFCSSDNFIYFNMLNCRTYTKTYVPAIYKGKTFYYNDKKLYFIDTNTVAFDNMPELSDEVLTSLMTVVFLDSHYIGIKLLGSVVIDGVEHTSLKKPIRGIAYCNDNEVYLTSDTEYYAKVYFNFNSHCIEESMYDKAIVAVVDTDPNTGYGFLTRKLDKFSVTSYLEDTELNFPNNVYYTMLAYMLAIAFKVKQGADITQLSVLLENVENTFYDTMVRDDWGYVRITNSY